MNQGSKHRVYRLLRGAAHDTNDQPKITNLRKGHLSLHPIPTTQQESTRQVRSSTVGPRPHPFSGLTLICLSNSLYSFSVHDSLLLSGIRLKHNKEKQMPGAGAALVTGDCPASMFPGLGCSRGDGSLHNQKSTSAPNKKS